MNHSIRRVLTSAVLLTAVGSSPGIDGVTGAAPLAGQAPAVVGADLPRSGELWIELAPTFESWDEQFALGSDSLPDGAREPLHVDYQGPLAERLYPGPDLLVEVMNRGADSLGYGPLGSEELSLGRLDFGSLTARRTAVPLRTLAGVTSRISLDLGLTLVQTQTEAIFSYDSTGATVAPASAVLPEGDGYLDGLSSAREVLRGRLEGGQLSSEEEEQARALLDRSGAFVTVLQRRLEGGGLLPLAASRAGGEMSSLASEFQTGFQEFEIEAPGLDLVSLPGRSALDAFFTGPLMEAEPLRGSDHGLQPARADLGFRVSLVDSFEPEGGSTEDSAANTGRGLRLRTTTGLRVGLPLGDADAAPFLTPDRFLDTPVGTGSREVEVTLYQDVAYRSLHLSAAAGYTRRLADQVTLRPHDPGHPFTLAGTSVSLDRDPGDHLWIRLSPRLSVNPALSLGAEYAYWRQDPTSFSLAGTGEEGEAGDANASSVSVLERETSATRQDLGVGVYYTARGDASPAGSRPVQVAFTYRLAFSGSGGQTPVANLMGVRIRVPIGVF